MSPIRPRRTHRAALAAATAALLAFTGACASAGGGSSDTTTVDLVGFAVPEAANEAIEEKFHETDAGKNIDIQGSYGASGDQSRKVEADPEIADYVHFSLEGDVTRLVDAGLIDENWKDNDNQGIVSRSVVVLVVPEGNPKNITGWDDLTRDDISIVTPDPDSSGAARWNILGAYGHAIAQGKSEEEANSFLVDIFGNVDQWSASGREATTAFDTGEYDVLISYENEAILARQNGKAYDYIVPDDTLLIENPGTVLKDAPEAATTWLNFVLSKTGQTEFAKKGFRPVIDGIDVEVEGANDPADPFPQPDRLLTIADDFGGWDAVNEKFFAEDGGLIKQLRDQAAQG
ncbi:MAG: sulfate ABC transporter substrate-binding protein [Aeromicrobium sp.]|uniref:sulfate ABC transporter substrate-binding protein n=1 Tax=Aeromicrobium sp. TaxID=1871063 RepID=UPI0039E64315